MGPNPQVFSQDLTRLFFSGVILKVISKFDVRMYYHQSYVVPQDLSNSSSHCFNFSILHPGVSQQLMLVFLVVILGFEDRRRFFSQSCSILFKIHGSSLLPSSHNCFRLREFFSPIRSNLRAFSVWFSEGHHFGFIHSQRVAIILQILPVHRSNIL